MNLKAVETWAVLLTMLLSLIMALRAHARARKEDAGRAKKNQTELSPQEKKEEEEVRAAVAANKEQPLPFWEVYLLKKRLEPIRERNQKRMEEINGELNAMVHRDTPAMLWTLLFSLAMLYAAFRGLT